MLTTWIKEKFGEDAVPWVYFTAAITLCVAGIAATIVFGVMGLGTGLAISIPTILVGGIGIIPTGIALEEGGYI